MEWYTLDDELRRDTVIEGFESFIWTERYQDVGDFQIVIKSTIQSRSLLTEGTYLGMKESDRRVMVIDTISDDTDQNGERNLTITGSSLEKILDDRVAIAAFTDTTTTPNWVITASAGDVCREVFTSICVDTILDAGDTIPFYHSGTLSDDGNLGEDDTEITVTISPDTVLNVIKQICATYFLGFRMVKDGDTGNIYFEIYVGDDHTSQQTTLTPVIFDPDIDNLEKISLLQSTASVKTVAYVIAANGAEMAFATGYDDAVSGAARRVLLVNSSNTGESGDDLNTALRTEGLIALSAQREIYSFDGELPQTIPYVYGVDYKLGDLVEERNSSDYGSQMLVTEQIFVSDNTGERSYPTLVLKQTITPGTWSAWSISETWDDEDESVTWDNVTS